MGKGLAKELDYGFFDLDEQIVTSVRKSIPKIFSEDGEGRFREIERDELRKIIDDRVVIATGGGAPCFHENMAWMNQNGFTIFLNQPLEIITERLEKQRGRPLIKGDVGNKIQELYDVRISYYAQAGMESDRTEPCEIADELRNLFS